jgi:uncharacterized RDD family membrane protein YckC
VAPGQAVCVECGRVFDVQEMIPFRNAHVCAGCKPVFMQKLAEGVTVTTGALNYAGFWIRAGAKVIDVLIIGVVFFPPIIYFVITAAAKRQPDRFQFFPLLFQFLYAAANVSYQVFFLGKYGATLGQKACGLRVVTADGDKISYARATGRVFAAMISGMICYIGYIMVGFDNQKRALHDHICNTRVVYK